jgi:hypothetical protein
VKFKSSVSLCLLTLLFCDSLIHLSICARLAKKLIEAYVGVNYRFKEIFRDGREYDFKLNEEARDCTLLEREIKEQERRLRVKERAQYNLDKEGYTLLRETCDTSLQQQLLQDSKVKEMERTCA